MLSRKKFLQISSLASASLMVPNFLKGFERRSLGAGNGRVLIVLQLSGGNDGLNTVIPYRNDIYYKGRPALSIKREDALHLTDEAGLHPSLKNIKQLYDDGHVSIINNVGYPEPNRSHFRSMDIWQSASSAEETVNTGWLGRYLEKECVNCNERNSFAIEVDDTLSLAMKGKDRTAIAVNDIRQFHNAASGSFLKAMSHHQEHDEHLAGYLYKMLRETTSAADYIYEQSKIYKSAQTYPISHLGRKLKTVGSLILSNTDTRVYYVSHGSFDTHVGQLNQQDRMFQQLDEAVMALVMDLKQNNRLNDVLIMTFSEFGRRVEQNASNGTDHGTASNMFLIGGGIRKAGLYNELPDLADLDQGDLKYKVDFKEVYSTILDKWLNTDSRAILGKKFSPMDFI